MKQFEMDTGNKMEAEKPHTNAEINIGGPVALWVGLSSIAAIIEIFLYPAFQNSVISPALSYLHLIAPYALYSPGVFVLPVLAGIWIGSRAGASTGTSGTIAYRAMINAVYASVIYLIEIFIFYMISTSTHTSQLASMPLPSFVEYIVVLPAVICLVVAPLFAIVSSARRY